jgi:hypothetical protein
VEARTGSAASANRVIAIYGLFVAGALAVIRYAKNLRSRNMFAELSGLIFRRPSPLLSRKGCETQQTEPAAFPAIFQFSPLNSLSSICLFILTRVGSEDTEMRTAYALHKDTETKSILLLKGIKGCGRT